MLGLASSEGLGITRSGNGKNRSVPCVLVILVGRREGLPLRAA